MTESILVFMYIEFNVVLHTSLIISVYACQKVLVIKSGGLTLTVVPVQLLRFAVCVQ